MTSQPKSHIDITLYRGFEDYGNYTWSPFVTKLEARMRFAGLSYHAKKGSFSEAPKAKIPYLSISKTDSVSDGQAAAVKPTFLADSALIIQKLVEDGLLEDINADLSPRDKAHDLAFRAMMEDKLYFYQTYEKWHENYYTMRDHVLAALPYPVKVVVGLLAYRKVCGTLHGQGTMRFSPEEIHAFRQEIWDSVNTLLVESSSKMMTSSANDNVFFVLGGQKPSEADSVLFGFICSALISTASPGSRKVVKSLPAVMDYAQRIHRRYFPDYTGWE